VEEATVLTRAVSLMRNELGMDDRALAASLRVHGEHVETLWQDIAAARVRPKVHIS
jgi:hypothetical protein